MSGFTDAPTTSGFSDAGPGAAQYLGHAQPTAGGDTVTAGDAGGRFTDAPSRFCESDGATAPPQPGPSRFADDDCAQPAEAAPAAGGEETLDVLQARMRTYREQLEDVVALIAEDPENDQIVAIKTDVEAAIAITHDKIQRLEALQNEMLYVEGAYVAGQLENGEWRTVRIMSVTIDPDSSAKRFGAVSVGYSQMHEFTTQQLRPWQPPVDIAKGSRVEAVNPSTGLWYPAEIDTITDANSVWVLFKGSKTVEEVQLTHVRLPKVASKKRPREEATGGTEAEEVDDPKRRKKKDAWRARVKEMKEVQAAPRKSWQEFCAKKPKLGAPRVGKSSVLAAGKPGPPSAAAGSQQQQKKFLGSGYFSRLHQF